MKVKRKYFWKKVTVACLAVAFLSGIHSCGGCAGPDAFSLRFEQLPQGGWWRTDTLTFSTDTITEAGSYVRTLHFRTSLSHQYPFRDVTFEVTRLVLPDSVVQTDTLHCNIFDGRDEMQGRGVVHHQFDLVVDTILLRPGQVSIMQVRHCMYKNPLPGISEVGSSCRSL